MELLFKVAGYSDGDRKRDEAHTTICNADNYHTPELTRSFRVMNQKGIGVIFLSVILSCPAKKEKSFVMVAKHYSHSRKRCY